jgi:hypothetical protein
VDSVAGAVSQKIVRACHLAGCARPVVRNTRRYCSRHLYLANIDYARRLLERPDVRAAREAARRLNDLERMAAPVQRVEAVRRLVEPVDTSFSPPVTFSSIDSSIKLARRLDALWEDFERAIAPLKRFLSILPAPPRMARFQREAKEAWLRFHQGDPEPLDSFIRKYLVRLKNREGPVPSKLRRGVMEVLDECFAPVLIYTPGAWYVFSHAAEEKLIGLVQSKFKKTESINYALSGDLGKSPTASLNEKLPGATLLAWEDIERGNGSGTILNRVERYLETEAQEAPKAYRIAEKRPGHFWSEDTDDSLAQFEAVEVMRQRFNALPRWIEEAALSPQERQVYELDQQTDFDTKIIARELGITEGHVRVVRSNYLNEIRSTAGL